MTKRKIKKANSKENKVVPSFGKERILAFMLDWFIAGILSGLPAVITYSQLTGTGKPIKDMYVFEALGYGKSLTLMLALACMAIGFLYYVIIPWKVYPGQTLGKKMLNLKIVSTKGKQIGFETYFLRNFLLLFFAEGVATPLSMYIRAFFTTITRFYVDTYLSWMWNVITIISMIMLFYSRKHLALHDYVSKTSVIKIKGERNFVKQRS